MVVAVIGPTRWPGTISQSFFCAAADPTSRATTAMNVRSIMGNQRILEFTALGEISTARRGDRT